jgi:hydroxyacylglutathione hydrolase
LPTLPDDVAVYPGHGAGSPCGKKIGDAAQTTIGQEKRFNYAFQTQSLDEFTRAVMTGMPQPPAYYPTMKRMNKVGPPLLRELPSGVALDADEIAARQAAGALLIDARPAAEFARRHIPGAVSVGLGPNFAIWCGWLAPYEREVIFVLPGDDLYPETLTELRRIGIDNVAGYLAGGIDAWSASGRPTGSLAEMSVSQLAARIEHPRNGLTVVDVRDATEWEGGHIPGARNVPAGALAQGTPAAIEEHATVAVICGSGYRSAVAASLLKAGGLQDVITVPGGMEAWSAAGNPLA